MLGECHISFFILSSLYFYLTLSILGRYSDLWVSANLHISFYPPYIQCIIEEFFLTNPDILLYQCETGDSRQAMRTRLFTRWFNEFDKRDRFCVKVSILRDEEVDNYIAIIVQKSNPKLNDILRDFDEFIGFFDTKPE